MRTALVNTRLQQLSIYNAEIDPISSKKGVHVYRVYSGNNTFILKYFENINDRREILNYKILQSLGVPVLKVIGSTDDCLLIEDINKSVYRYAVGDDLNDPSVAKHLAQWYRRLHDAGAGYAGISGLYDEADIFTEANLKLLMEKTGNPRHPFWKEIFDKLPIVRSKLNELKKTINYNDFYWTNMVVAKDGSSAIMFDYNLMGKGYRYADIRNVCFSMGEAAAAAFKDTYGCFDVSEIIIDEFVSELCGLIKAFKCERVPKWAFAILDGLDRGVLTTKLNTLCNL